MRFVFRCDERPSSGLGHVMRCRALSDVLIGRGHETVFARREDARTDACDAVIVDSYEVLPSDIARWSQIAPVVVVDDLADRDLRDACAVINQNFGAERLTYNAGNATLLLGPSFAMLRPQFVHARRQLSRTFSLEDGRVLLTLGGGPVTGHLLAILAEMEKIERSLEITILGIAKPERFSSHHRTSFLRFSEDAASLMAQADACVAGGGVTALELACLGTPTVVTVLAPNQEPAAAELERTGSAVVLGQIRGAIPRLAAVLAALLGNPERRKALSELSMARVDGEGAGRLASFLETIGST